MDPFIPSYSFTHSPIHISNYLSVPTQLLIQFIVSFIHLV